MNPKDNQARAILRDLIWVSIDNDDSFDLDQLAVAKSLPGGKIEVLVAVADVDALIKKERPSTSRRATIRPPFTRQPRPSPCFRKSSPPTSHL